MSLFYEKIVCNRIPGTARCQNKINREKCPLITNPGETTVKNHTLCMKSIRKANERKIFLFTHTLWASRGYPKTSWQAEEK